MKNAVRDSLKEKMLAAGPDQMVEVNAMELVYVMHGDMATLTKEVEDIRAKQHTIYPPSEVAEAQEDQKTFNADYVARAQASLDKPPATDTRPFTFEEAVTPLIRWMAENSCPHSHIVITGTSAELFHGAKSFNTFDFVKG